MKVLKCNTVKFYNNTKTLKSQKGWDRGGSRSALDMRFLHAVLTEYIHVVIHGCLKHKNC